MSITGALREPTTARPGPDHPEDVGRIAGWARSAGQSPLWQAVGVYGVMTAVVLYPVLSVRVPALTDYLNHLARMHILADIDHSQALGRFYQVHWQAFPYLAMDAAFVLLNHVANIYDAGRIFVALCVVLPVAGVAALHFAVHRRFSLVPAAAFLCCYNFLLAWGFLNYLLTLSLAVFVFAGWIASAGWPRWPRAALFCGLATGLYLGHLVAFGAYGLMLAGFELGRAGRAGFRPWREFAADWLAAALQAIPAIGLALSLHVDHPVVGPVPAYDYGTLINKVVALYSPVLFLVDPVDFIASGAAALVLILGLLSGRLRLAPSVWPATVAVGMVAVAMPTVLFGVFGVDFRLPLLVALLLIGGLSATQRMGRLPGCAVLGGLLALTVADSVRIAATLQTLDAQMAQVRRVVGDMPRGMRLLLVDTSLGQPTGPLWRSIHAGMTAVIDRDAFVPTLLTGFMAVHPAPSWRTSSTPTGGPLPLSALTEGLGRQDVPGEEKGNGLGTRIYWMGWETKFDYVLIQHFDGQPVVPPPPRLRLVAGSAAADLYRIDNTLSP